MGGEIVMNYTAHIEQSEDGEYTATCEEFGISAHGLSAPSALQALRLGVQYELEYCPCSSVPEEYIEFDVVEKD